MTTVLVAPEDIVNAALARIGYKLRIGSLYDGSEQSRVALDLYSQTRDQLLRAVPWGFAEEIAAATAAAGAPPAAWGFWYLYPSNCIKLRNLYNPAYLSDPNNPSPSLWEIASLLVGGVLTKVILSQVANATLIYTAQVTNPVLWEPGFIEGLIAALARRLTPGFGASPELLKFEPEDEKAEGILAATEIG